MMKKSAFLIFVLALSTILSFSVAPHSADATTLCMEMNEGGSDSITCPAGEVVTSIDFASYGTPNGMCGAYTIGACHESNSSSYVSGQCLNNTSCSITADNGIVGGDPCVGTFKRMYAQVTCSTAPVGASNNVSGYAWSDTIGWLSFNCTNDGTCGVSNNYGVNEGAGGFVTGYAWSDNIGWVKFGGLSSFPGGLGTVAQDAQLVGSNLVGWARACAGTLSGDCSDMADRTDGWDGWIALSGTNYGVTKVGANYVGYAWGGEVVGWLLFDIQGQVPGGCTGTCGVTVGGGTADFDVKSGGPTGPSIANDPSVPWGTIPTFVWTISQPTMSCDLTKTAGGTPFTDLTGLNTNGSQSGNALTVAGVHTYEFDCTNPAFNKTVSFTVAPQATAFSMGGTETIRIQFAGPGAAESEIKTLSVTPSGPFTNPVTISITGFPTPPVGVTYTYSLGGSPFSANPAPVVINSPYGSGQAFQVRVSSKVTAPFTVTLTGTAAGAPDATKDIIVDPRASSPVFIEF